MRYGAGKAEPVLISGRGSHRCMKAVFSPWMIMGVAMRVVAFLAMRTMGMVRMESQMPASRPRPRKQRSQANKPGKGFQTGATHSKAF
jgi:hypothetical protein